jgi:hypothetical protein
MATTMGDFVLRLAQTVVSAREAFFNAPAKRASRRSEREQHSAAAHFLEQDFWTTTGASLQCGSLF